MYYLMNKDEQIGIITNIGDKYDAKYVLRPVSNMLPIGFRDINEWLRSRHIGNNREYIKQLIRKYMYNTLDGIIKFTHCVSINDTYWVKHVDEKIQWSDVSPYTNQLNDWLSLFAISGMEHGKELSTGVSPELSTGGSFPKCVINDGNHLNLIKRGSDSTDIECYAECLFMDVYERLIDHCVHYDVVRYHDRVASSCKIFSDEEIGYASYWTVYRDHSFKKMWDRYKAIGNEELFSSMLAADILCLNFDRHTNNHGFLIDNEKQTILSMAPIFDENLAGLPYLEKEQFQEIIEYADSLNEGYYEKELEKAKDVMTANVKRRLEYFVDYTLPYESLGTYDSDRVNLMNHIIRGHARRLLR